MLPSLAKDFYLPPQHGHGTSVMLSIFCSVLLCFMGLCKGSRLTGWADLDSQPVGACAVDGVTSRALANQGQGCVASAAAADTQDDIMFHTNSQRNMLVLWFFIRAGLYSEQKADFHWRSQRV